MTNEQIEQAAEAANSAADVVVKLRNQLALARDLRDSEPANNAWYEWYSGYARGLATALEIVEIVESESE